jgi:hypothetical protein
VNHRRRNRNPIEIEPADGFYKTQQLALLFDEARDDPHGDVAG